MSSFFLPARPAKGEKRQKAKNPQKGKLKKRQSSKTQGTSAKRPKLNEEIHSESEGEGEEQARADYADHFAEEGEEEEETAQEKRLRLAKQYLGQLEDQEREQKDLKELDRDAISHRLQQDVLEQSGRMIKTVADSYVEPTVNDIRYCRGHQLPLTCVTVTSDSKFVFSGAKDCSIIKWRLDTGQKCCVLPGHRKGIAGSVCHTGHILALAVSSDDKFLVSGGGDRVIHVWSAETCTHLHTFKGHREAVTGLVFRRESHELFSCSEDRTVKLWNLDEMSYVETLYGHQDPITSIDCLFRERPVTSGGADKSVRVWKIVEESQLVYGGHRASTDCVRLITEENFVTGSQDGSIALWSVAKKKPVQYRPHDPTSKGVGTCISENWVSAVAALPFSDLVASGAADGVIHLWRCSEGFSSIHPLFTVHVGGCINSLSFSPCGGYLVAALGREHKFGRWWCDKGAKNRLVVIAMRQSTLSDSKQSS